MNDNLDPKSSSAECFGYSWERFAELSPEPEALMAQAGLEQIKLAWVNQVSWSAIGTKPGNSPGA